MFWFALHSITNNKQNEIKHYSKLQCITHQNTRALFKYELTTISSNMFWIILYIVPNSLKLHQYHAFRKCLTMSRNKVFVYDGKCLKFELLIKHTHAHIYPNVPLLEIHIDTRVMNINSGLLYYVWLCVCLCVNICMIFIHYNANIAHSHDKLLYFWRNWSKSVRKMCQRINEWKIISQLLFIISNNYSVACVCY